MKFGIRSRLYGGFACLLLIAAGLGMFAQHGLSRVVDQYETRAGYERRARHVFTSNSLAARLDAQAQRYRAAPEAETLSSLEESRRTLEALCQDMAAEALSDERRKTYVFMQDAARELQGEIRRLGTTGAAISAAKDRLFVGGDELTRATGVLLSDVRVRGNDAQIAQAVTTESAVLLARVSNWRFLATLDPKGPATFATNAAKAETALRAFGKLDAAGAFAQQAGAVERALATYVAAFQATSAALGESQAIYETGIKVRTNKIVDSGERLRTQIQTAVDEIAAAATAQVGAVRLVQTGLLATALALGFALAFFIARSLIRPIVGMTESMKLLAAGDTAVNVPSRDATDEMGEMAKAVDVFRLNAIARTELEATQAMEQSARQRRADRVDQLVRTFQRNVAQSLVIVTSAATELDATARSMNRVADDTNGQAVASSAAAEETSVNVQTVAAAAEEMVASLQEIERQVIRSNEVASEAAREAEATNEAMQGLDRAAKQIGAAVTTISAIAGQTNLLALNATIEAVRAGDAGRGFAVVAAEVKQLAGQTTRATEEIAAQIAEIQTATGRAAMAMGQIGRTIAAMNEISTAIASTVTEQAAATGEISRNADEAARGTRDVSANVARVLNSSGETGSAAAQVLDAAAGLAAQSLAVKGEVDGFLADIQAA